MTRVSLTAVLPLIISFAGYSQTVVEGTDKANNGQLKRMVFQQWDDWQPDPGTDFLGLPDNPEGWFYWQVLHNSYYTGQDSRPYRVGGPFDQNDASLVLQDQDDQKITDSTKEVFNTNILTYTNMSGGALDIPWSMYFGDQFNTLTNEVVGKMPALLVQSPDAYNAFTNDKYYKNYLEYLDVTKDRLNTIHQGLLDKGDRIIAYLEIMKELQKKNKVIEYMLNIYVAAASRMTTVNKVNSAAQKQVIPNSDGQIVKNILSNYQF